MCHYFILQEFAFNGFKGLPVLSPDSHLIYQIYHLSILRHCLQNMKMAFSLRCHQNGIQACPKVLKVMDEVHGSSLYDSLSLTWTTPTK